MSVRLTNEAVRGDTARFRHLRSIPQKATVVFQNPQMQRLATDDHDAHDVEVPNNNMWLVLILEDARRQKPDLGKFLRWFSYAECMKMNVKIKGSPSFFEHSNNIIFPPGAPSVWAFHRWLITELRLFVDARKLVGVAATSSDKEVMPPRYVENEKLHKTLLLQEKQMEATGDIATAENGDYIATANDSLLADGVSVQVDYARMEEARKRGEEVNPAAFVTRVASRKDTRAGCAADASAASIDEAVRLARERSAKRWNNMTRADADAFMQEQLERNKKQRQTTRKTIDGSAMDRAIASRRLRHKTPPSRLSGDDMTLEAKHGDYSRRRLLTSDPPIAVPSPVAAPGSGSHPAFKARDGRNHKATDPTAQIDASFAARREARRGAVAAPPKHHSEM